MPEKVNLIQDFKRPKNVKKLQKLLGFLIYYSKFVNNHSELITPLLPLLRKNERFKWNQTHEQAFETIKKVFQDTMMLIYPNPYKKYILTCDANYYNVAGILSQENDEGQEEIVIMISTTLKGSQLNDFITEKELYAIFWSLKKLEAILFGALIEIHKDHKALEFLEKCR